MKEGYYRVEYVGPYGTGFAMIAVDHGAIHGVDVGDGVYSGSYAFNARTGFVDVELTFRVPPGAWLVTDGKSRTSEETQRIAASLPVDAEAVVTAIQTPTGPVVVTLRRIADLPS